MRRRNEPKGGAGAGSMGFCGCTLHQLDRADRARRLSRYLRACAGGYVSMGGRRARRARAWCHVARKRPRGGPWVACNRAGARLRSAGHRFCCPWTACPSIGAWSYPSASSASTRRLGWSVLGFVATSSPLHTTWRPHLSSCATWSQTCASSPRPHGHHVLVSRRPDRPPTCPARWAKAMRGTKGKERAYGHNEGAEQR